MGAVRNIINVVRTGQFSDIFGGIYMKALFVHIYTETSDFEWGLMEYGIDLTEYEHHKFDPNETDAMQKQVFFDYLKKNPFEYVFSNTFIPDVSDVCEELNTWYVSWVYDSPQAALYTDSLQNAHNITFVFDKTEAKELGRWGRNICYLPLAGNITRTGALEISEEDEKKFSCEISLVGSLYTDNSYNKWSAYLTEELGEELNTYLRENMWNWRKTKDWPLVSEEFVKHTRLLNVVFDSKKMDERIFLGIMFLSRKLAQIDRTGVLNTLGEHFPVTLFTGQKSDQLYGIDVRDRVNYYTDMSRIFYLSRINLNITLPSIRTGVPQRIYDIMGVGGFVMTNAQEEIFDLFDVGREIEVYRSMEELIDKTAFYLNHDNSRLKVALNGYKAIRDRHNLQIRMGEMMRMIEEVTG